MNPEYLKYSPALVRFKVIRVLEDEKPEGTVDRKEIEELSVPYEVFQKADEELEKAITRFPKIFYKYFNKPVLFTLDHERAFRLIDFLERKCGHELSESAAKISLDGKIYIISFEYPCG